MNNTIAAYWMLADTEVPLSWDPNQLQRFESLLKHALLFNHRLMISDTQAVNCVNLRRLLQQGGGFHELLHRDVFEVAIRTEANGQQASLVDLRDNFAARGINRFASDDFLRNDDLDIIQRTSNVRPYELSNLSQLYTDSVQALLYRDDVKATMTLADRDMFRTFMDAELARNGYLTREFMQNTMAAMMCAEQHDDIWGRHHQVIRKISDAPYITALPQVLSASPIYSPRHQSSFDFVYGVAGASLGSGSSPDSGVDSGVDSGSDKVFSISSALNLSGYELGLRQLTPDDIFDLRGSIACRDYLDAITQSVSDVNQLDEIYEKLAAYQEVIDTRIIERYAGLKVNRVDADTNRWQAGFTRRLCADSGEFMFGLAIDMLAAPIAFGSFFVNEVRERKRWVKKRTYNRHRAKLATIISRAPDVSRVEASRLARPTLDTVYRD
ncbi:hypothetical protein [Aliidiomarina maris]|uniref:Uncharacterized protein n=1 Tax=Aliidiomarina maris TaxID=531312 RepID=A0A327WMQ6_9GAMM|nr:hypothetical protein [Aliidiomarina maris]RAJ92971.1 hypothetical protein B0I24_12115 [Aliidiomarina maris]RUO18461.1 hypothetical protein CWE07_13995 [Aliidiomarina maris]